jgi:hypothetical protein
MDNPTINTHGTKRWFDANGKLHRDDGPALERTSGAKSWWQHGKIHRDDGPAVERADGDNWWYLYGQRLSFDVWLDKVDMSDEEKVMMKLKYG